MRKLTVHIKPNALMRKNIAPVFKTLERIEGQELLKMDFKYGVKIAVADIFAKPGVEIDEHTDLMKNIKILNIFKKKGNKYTCLLKVNMPKHLMKIMKLFDLEVIYDVPIIMRPDRLTYTLIAEEKMLRKFFKIMKLMGTIEKTIFLKADYKGHGIQNVLTEKQNKILQEAIKWGYYKYPREIDTDELSKRVGVSRTTLVEHLRKAENRIMEQIIVK